MSQNIERICEPEESYHGETNQSRDVNPYADDNSAIAWYDHNFLQSYEK